eukprot:365249-Chlamydomonas_euryale.AAC.18
MSTRSANRQKSIYCRDTRKWGSPIPGIGDQASPIVAAAEKPRRGQPQPRCGASITAAARPHSATAPVTAHERDDIDLIGEPPVKKRMILPKNLEGSSYGCAALGGAHGLFGGCPF